MRVVMPSHTRIHPKRLAIGRRIAAARAKTGLSQAALATKLGLSAGAITQWETGRVTPEPDKFQALAEALGVEVGWLLTGDEPDEVARAQTVTEQEALLILRRMKPEEQARAMQILAALAEPAPFSARIGLREPKKPREK